MSISSRLVVFLQLGRLHLSNSRQTCRKPYRTSILTYATATTQSVGVWNSRTRVFGGKPLRLPRLLPRSHLPWLGI